MAPQALGKSRGERRLAATGRRRGSSMELPVNVTHAMQPAKNRLQKRSTITGARDR
jgi:hypothetical protein